MPNPPMNAGLSSVLSLMVIGVSVVAEFGAETENAVVVVHGVAATGVWVETQPAGSAGATTPSNFSARNVAATGPQVSPVVHGLPSSHGALLIVWPQAPVAAMHASSVQTLPSSQLTGVPAQIPPPQTSFTVQRLPSLQAAVLFMWTQPVIGSQESSVHGLPSSQLTAQLVVEHTVVVISSVQPLSVPVSPLASSDDRQRPGAVRVLAVERAERLFRDERRLQRTVGRNHGVGHEIRRGEGVADERNLVPGIGLVVPQRPVEDVAMPNAAVVRRRSSRPSPRATSG